MKRTKITRRLSLSGLADDSGVSLLSKGNHKLTDSSCTDKRASAKSKDRLPNESHE